MATEQYADNAITTLAGTGQPWAAAPAAGTSESWQVASTAAPFPQAVAGTSQFRIALSPVSPVDATPEICIVTNTIDATHWQVTRGAEAAQGGAAPKVHASGDQAACVLTAVQLAAFSVGGGATYTWTPTKTAAYSAVTGDAVPCDTTTAGFTVTLPAGVKDNTVRVRLSAGTNTLTVAVASAGTINGNASYAWSNLTGSYDFSCISPGVWVIV